MASNPNSILDSVKKVIGLDSTDTTFDLDMIVFVNSSFGSLLQVGVGPRAGFSISDNSTFWTDYTNRNDLVGMVKSYMCLTVRMAFDPPATSFAIAAFEKQIEELLWRINVQAESIQAYASVWWILDGLSDFPSIAQPGDWGFDSTTGAVYVNGTRIADGYWYDLTGESDFPVDAVIGDLGYDTNGNVWRKTA